jgi:serine/threonine protein kinase
MRAPRPDLPILVARLSAAKQAFLAGAALAKNSLYVPLLAPPTSSALHVLEVWAPGDPTPLEVYAQPLGPVTDVGYPLALSIPEMGEPVARKITQEWAGPTEELHAAPPSNPEPPVARESLVGRALAGGKLVIEAEVGSGGAGTVYRARHRDLRMPVAVKVMHESLQRDAAFAERFHAEALAASRLDHPSLTRVLDFGQEPDGLLYIAMEFLDGRSLRDVLAAEGKLSLDRAIGIMIHICSALTHTHARHVVHGDIKPENLVLVRGLDEDGRESEMVKVCDFGIAHRPTSMARTVPIGTPEYMAPELLRGGEPDVQTDVYACGVVLYELLTGEVPIAGEFPEIAARVQSVEPTPPSGRVPGLDAHVDRLVLKALAKDRTVRYAGVKELRSDLKVAVEEAALFVAGGYWKRLEETPAAPPVAAAAREASGDGPDWIERGPLQSMVPTASSVAPAAGPAIPAAPRAPLPASLLPPMRASAPSFSSMEMPSSPNLPSLHPSMRPPSIRAGEGVASASVAPPPLDASGDPRGVGALLRQIMQATDPAKFAAGAPRLAATIRELMADADASVLWRLRSTLAEIASESSPRAAHARELLRPLVDPQLLAPIAERALDGIADRDGAASKVIARAGKGGAYALYAARLKQASFEARERFVRILRTMGDGALAMVSAGLTRLESRLSLPGATALAEDLLRALPDSGDDALAAVVARYAKSQVPSLALAATSTLPKLLGAGAKPLLVDLLDHRNDAVATAAIKALRDLSLVDVDAVRALEPLVLGDLSLRIEPRIAALEALAKPTHPALGAARTLLARVLRQTAGTTPHAEDVLVAAATSLLASGGDGTLVAERWRASTAFLRTRLEAVLRSHQRGT